MKLFQKSLAGWFWLLMAQASFGAITEPVRLDSGLISGVAGTQAGVRVFKGIPYAAPPVGDLRWRAPLPPAAWEGVRKADTFSPICPQVLTPTNSFYGQEFFWSTPPPMSEDCLYLNVWTAAQSAAERRPVMLWIHGGSNVQGYGSEPCFDGEAFARKGVVLVTINYRLGIFSCFAHPELSKESAHQVSGNYGELDQIAALQWVRRNIAAFGGNPTNVTIFGESSGGTSVNRLLASPVAKGWFQKAIVQSAVLWSSRDAKSTLAEMEKRGVAFAMTNNAGSLKELRALPASALLDGFAKMRFYPNTDGWLLPDRVVDIFARGGQTAVPLLIGSTADEGQFIPVQVATFRADMQKQFGAEADKFFTLYPAGSDAEAAQSRHDEGRDESAAGERAEAAEQAALGQPVWLYYFDRAPPGRDRKRYGAFHAAELEYVFNTQGATDRPWEDTDRQLAARMIAYWANFAATGNPNGPGLPAWPAYDAKTDLTMELGARAGERPVPNQAQLDFLKDFLDKNTR